MVAYRLLKSSTEKVNMLMLPGLGVLLLTLLAHGHHGYQAHYPPVVPDAKLTPGDRYEQVTADDLCRPEYLESAKPLSDARKREVFRRYGIKPTTHVVMDGDSQVHIDDFAVSHLIPVELGGTDNVKNLWVQSTVTKPWNAQVKARLDHEMYRKVCAGVLTLREAQDTLASNWIAAYSQHLYERPTTASAEAMESVVATDYNPTN